MSRNLFSSSKSNPQQVPCTLPTEGDRRLRPQLRRMPRRSLDLRSALRPPYQVAAAVGMPSPASSSSSAAQPSTNRALPTASSKTEGNSASMVTARALSKVPSTGQGSQTQVPLSAAPGVTTNVAGLVFDSRSTKVAPSYSLTANDLGRLIRLAVNPTQCKKLGKSTEDLTTVIVQTYSHFGKDPQAATAPVAAMVYQGRYVVKAVPPAKIRETLKKLSNPEVTAPEEYKRPSWSNKPNYHRLWKSRIPGSNKKEYLVAPWKLSQAAEPCNVLDQQISGMYAPVLIHKDLAKYVGRKIIQFFDSGCKVYRLE